MGKKKKEKKVTDLSEEEKQLMEKLKNNIMEKEAELKGAMSAKDVENEKKQKKGDEKEIAKLRDEIDAYKLKLKEEFGYSKQDCNKDPDLVEMQQRYKGMGGK